MASIYQRIGFSGLVDVVLKSTPVIHKLTIIPLVYDIFIYKNFLEKSHNLDELLSRHSDKYHTSRVFKLLRPKYGEAKYVLLSRYNIEP